MIIIIKYWSSPPIGVKMNYNYSKTFMEEMTMGNYTTKEIEKSREKFLSLAPVSRKTPGWLFSPQFLAILQISQIAKSVLF
jgi:hypothetical protein